MSDAVIRAVGAQQLLDNETFQALLAAIEQDAVDELADADVAQPEALVRATANLQAARRLRARAQSLVTTGKAAGRANPAVA